MEFLTAWSSVDSLKALEIIGMFIIYTHTNSKHADQSAT